MWYLWLNYGTILIIIHTNIIEAQRLRALTVLILYISDFWSYWLMSSMMYIVSDELGKFINKEEHQGYAVETDEGHEYPEEASHYRNINELACIHKFHDLLKDLWNNGDVVVMH